MFSDISSFKELVLAIIGTINYIIPVLVSFALLAFMITGVRLVWGAGGKHRKERKNALLWSLVALFVIVSLWGLVNLLLDTFFPSAPYLETWTNYPVEIYPE